MRKYLLLSTQDAYSNDGDLLDYEHIPFNKEINERLFRDFAGVVDENDLEIYSVEERKAVLKKYEKDDGLGVRLYPDGGYYKIDEIQYYVISTEYYTRYQLRNVHDFQDYISFICKDLGIDFEWKPVNKQR